MRTPAPSRRPHDDSPDTSAAFKRLATLPCGPERDAVREELVRAWLPMAERIASRFRNRGEFLEDLRQVAALGLVKAVDGYDVERGAFESYAVPTITGEIKRHFRDRMWTLHVPRRVQDLRNTVRAARKELQASGSREPTIEQIAAHTGLSQDDVRSGLEALDSFTALSLDAELLGTDGGFSFSDTVGAPDAAFDVILAREAVKPALRRLPEREQKVLYLRFFRGMTQSQIGAELGLSQMHISRLISRTCARIREQALRERAPGRPVGAEGDGGGAAGARGRHDARVDARSSRPR
ncbi:SigB/SigF/SigG family RNA polymerase sigma factor [Streptomyces sp. NPDC051322]|uniref:SigB/SigF/SigG family RNA polymerase sigma factor n=1 Tax=Streptomyces sp. NPDC051322 TaxID=3154645 RepID=UPI00344B1D11